MKKEKNLKSKKWLWLVIGLVAVLAVAGVVLALLLPGQQDGEAQRIDAELYWNIDGAYYMEITDVPGFSAREPAEDGNYYISFAYNGQQVEKQIIDKQLVNYIDNMTVVGLVFDADGVVVDAVSPREVATEKALDFYVKKVFDDKLILDSSQALNGMELELAITENTGIYDVSGDVEPVGQPVKPEPMDRVTVYSDLEDTQVTHIYVTKHPVEAGIYWRVARMYDTELKQTTRVPDENGVYTIEFAHEGQIVELKCKDPYLVTEIDSKAVLMGQFALLFDEEGYITGTTDVALALRGKYMASDYHITAVDGDTYTATRISSGTDQGRTVTFKMAQDGKIYQCCQQACYGDHCGEPIDSLQMYDRVNVYGNVDSEAVLVFVTRRCVDSPMYYNYDRQYGGAAKGTNRKMQSDGYYHFEMLVDGKVETVRAATKEMADKMEALSDGCMGLQLNGNVVERVYDPVCVYGGSALGGVVTSMSGPMVTLTSSYSGASWNKMLSGDCKIYNAVTGEYGKEVGGTMDLQVGDSVTTYRNYADEICVVFVRSRPVSGAKVYYNLVRQYDADKKQTKRVPDEEGYYEFLMACEGKQVTVRTKSKGMASFIDQQMAPLAGLRVNGSGVITNAYSVDAVVPNSAKACNYRYVENVTKTSFNTFYIPSGSTTKVKDTTTWTIAQDCKVYNVSTSYAEFRGEKSTLKNGDYIQAIRNLITNEITQIFIMQRDPTFGVPSYKADCSHCGKNVTWAPYGGKLAEGDGHYFLCCDLTVNQSSVGKKDDDKCYDVVLDLKGYSLTGATRTFLVYDSLTVMDSKGGGKLAGTTPTAEGVGTSGSCIMVAEGGKLNIMGGELTVSDKSTAFGKYGGVLYIGTNCQVTMSGGKITGGTATTMGGNVAILGGSFTMTGGEISGGTAPNGAAIRVNSGSFTMTGGTVDGEITHGTNGVVELSGAPVITGLGLAIPAGKKLDVTKLTQGASVAVKATGIFTEPLTNAESYLTMIKPGAEGDKIIVKNSALCYISSGPSAFVLDPDNDGMAVCPACGGEEVSWAAVSAGERIGAGASGHYYIKEDSTDPSTQFATTTTKDAVLCIHMNGKKLTTSGRIATVGSGGTINIMGEGTITGSGSYSGENAEAYTLATLIPNSGGSINLYDKVTVTTTAAGKPVVKVLNNANIKLYGNATIQPMEGGQGIVIEKGKLTVDAAWTGSALVKFPTELNEGVVPRTNGASTGAFTGTLLLDAEGTPKLVAYKGGLALEGATGSGSDFVLDPDNDGKAVCPVCGGDEVEWIPVAAGDRVGASTSGHFYLAADSIAPNSQYATTAAKEAVLCIHLNGKSVTTAGRIATVGSGGTINIMGEGTITGSGSYTGKDAEAYTLATLIPNSGGSINLYDDVTVTTTAAGKPVVKVLNNANIKLYGNATIQPMEDGQGIVIEKGKLTVDAGWNGSALVKFPTELVDGAVPAANGASSGDFTGTLTLDAEGTPKLIAKDGGLAVEEMVPEDELIPDENGYAVCPVCGGDPVLWTAVAGNIGSDCVDGGHYYLADSLTTTGQFLTMTGNKTVCLHLNGKNLTYGSRIFVTGSTLNIMGTGTVTSTSTTETNLGALVAAYGNGIINLYGGSYKTTSTSGAPVVTTVGSVTAAVNVCDGVSIESAAVEKGNLNISGKSNVGSISVATDGKLSVAADWTGKAYVTFPVIDNGIVAAKNGISAGAFTGQLTTAISGTGYYVIAKDGGLALEAPAAGATDFVLDPDGDGKAVCPVCGGEEVAWTAVAAGDRVGASTSGHFYLAADSTNTGTQYATTATKEAVLCIHLNGKSVTTAGRIATVGSGGTINIMGEGTITGSGSYSGTDAEVYTRATLIPNSGGFINLYDKVTVTTTVAGKPVVNVLNNANIKLYGNATVVPMSGGEGILIEKGKLTVDGGWTGSALVKFPSVPADGIIPEANGASTGDFTGTLLLDTEGTPKLIAKDSGLALETITPEMEIARAKAVTEAANAMDFSNANSLPTTCPACGGNNVTWTAVSSTGRIGNAATGHYYLSGDVSCAVAWTQYVTAAQDGMVCLHLNGMDLTYGGRIALTYTGSTLNIMGNGTVTSTGECTNATYTTAALYLEAADSTLNLYGGTYTATKSGQYVLQTKTAATAKVNIYEGAILVDSSTTDPAATPVADPVMMIAAGTVNMYGGEVKNGTGTAGGNVRLSKGTTFNMYAGTITGGRGNYGGNVSMDVNTTFNMLGGTISNGTSVHGGGNIYSKGTVNIDGGTLTGGSATGSNATGGSVYAYAATVNLVSGSISGGQTTESATHGGNVSLTGGSVMNISGGSITGGSARYQAGNLQISNSTVVMTGGEISGGTATTATNHNIWLYGTSVMTMTGGTVKGVGDANGTAIYLSSGTTLNLGGTANVTRDDAVAKGNIYVSSGAKLNVLSDWTGNASVKFATAYAAGAQIAATDGQCGTWAENALTAGGSYTGTLICETNGKKLIGVDGALKAES